MKKISLLLVLLLSLSLFSGCSDKDTSDSKPASQNEEKQSDEKAAKADTDEVKTAEDDEVVVEGSNEEVAEESATAKIEAYIEKSNANGEIDAMIEQYKAQGMDFKLFARGESLVYRADYTGDVPSDASAKLEASAKQSEASLKSAADMIKAEEPAVKTVVYEYYDKNGNLLYSCEY